MLPALDCRPLTGALGSVLHNTLPTDIVKFQSEMRLQKQKISAVRPAAQQVQKPAICLRPFVSYMQAVELHEAFAFCVQGQA